MKSDTQKIDEQFALGVFATMREERIGLEPAIASFTTLATSGPVGMLADLLGVKDGMQKDAERGAEYTRAAVAKAREIVALADQGDASVDPRIEYNIPDDEPDVKPCHVCGSYNH